MAENPPSVTSITAVMCVRCQHSLMEHGAVGERPDLDPEYMACEIPGCECVDFQMDPCKFGDSTCPCNDGDLCNYVDDPVTGTLAFPPPDGYR